jgi:hypothetical protein
VQIDKARDKARDKVCAPAWIQLARHSRASGTTEPRTLNPALAQTGGFASASTVRAEALAAGAVALALYLATLQRGVSLPDSAVVMEAMQGPVVSAFACNHTLNNLIGWLACRLLPYGTLAWRCNAVSALYGAAVVGLFHALVRRLGASRTLAALCTATLAVSHGVWWHATVVENYALSAVFFLACAHLLVAENVDAKVARRRLFALFFLAGLALLNHLQNGVLLVGCALALGRRPTQGWRPAAAGAVLGVAPWLAVVVWELSTGRAGAEPVSWVLGGGGFEQAMFRHEACGGFAELARLLVWNHPGPFACVVVIGLAWALLPRAGAFRPLGRLVGVVVAGNALFFLGYATWDRFSFFLVPWVAADVAAAGWLVSCERRWPLARRRRLLYPVLALGVAAAPLVYTWQTRRLAEAGRSGWLTRNYVQVAADYRERYDLAGMLLDPVRRDGGTIERFVRRALAALPPGAVWVDDGSTYDQVKWLQRREGLRTDVAVELLAHPVMPGRGTEARQLAMRCQWSGGGRRWFIVADRGPSAELIDALRPFGWRRVPFPVGEGTRLFELVQDAGAAPVASLAAVAGTVAGLRMTRRWITNISSPTVLMTMPMTKPMRKLCPKQKITHPATKPSVAL